MVPFGAENGLSSDRPTQAHAFADAIAADAIVAEKAALQVATTSILGLGRAKQQPLPRRTPRVSLIVVLPENHVLSPDRLAHGLRARKNQDIDIVVACAGQPTNLSALQRSVGDAQFLLAPAGTTTEDLRELAMRQVPGDIVTLLSGALLPEAVANTELSMTS